MGTTGVCRGGVGSFCQGGGAGEEKKRVAIKRERGEERQQAGKAGGRGSGLDALSVHLKAVFSPKDINAKRPPPPPDVRARLHDLL